MSKTVLITGATGNLGTAVCKILTEAGYKVYGTSLPDSGETSSYAEIIETDLTSKESTNRLVDQITQNGQQLYCLICLAGGFGMNNIKNTSAADILHYYNLNLITTINAVQSAWKSLQVSGAGKIIMIGAKPAVEGGAFDVLPYALSKGSVIQLANILNEKTKETGISTSVIVPSIIDTPLNRKGMPNANYKDWVKPEDIANQIAHLLAGKSNALRNTLLKMYGNS